MGNKQVPISASERSRRGGFAVTADEYFFTEITPFGIQSLLENRDIRCASRWIYLQTLFPPQNVQTGCSTASSALLHQDDCITSQLPHCGSGLCTISRYIRRDDQRDKLLWYTIRSSANWSVSHSCCCCIMRYQSPSLINSFLFQENYVFAHLNHLQM